MCHVGAAVCGTWKYPSNRSYQWKHLKVQSLYFLTFYSRIASWDRMKKIRPKQLSILPPQWFTNWTRWGRSCLQLLTHHAWLSWLYGFNFSLSVRFFFYGDMSVRQCISMARLLFQQPDIVAGQWWFLKTNYSKAPPPGKKDCNFNMKLLLYVCDNAVMKHITHAQRWHPWRQMAWCWCIFLGRRYVVPSMMLICSSQ